MEIRQFIGRIKALNGGTIKNGKYVLLWMQSSQRVEYNHALEYSILKANELNKPIIVFFGLTDGYPEANERHYHFMLEGLNEIRSSLEDRGIQMVIRHKSPELVVTELSKKSSIVVVDRGYLEIERRWREYAAKRIDVPFIQVESNVVVPVEEASMKEEYSAATFRPKINRKLSDYLVPIVENNVEVDYLEMDFKSIDITNIEKTLSDLNIDRSVKKVVGFKGGTCEAKERLKDFLKNKLDLYPDLRNDPNFDYTSNLSPYLHFGQISPLHIALKVSETDSPGKAAYLEELIVRRELSMNFVFYNRSYGSFNGLPEWAKKTLKSHEGDPREYVYEQVELENAETHDPYWNAAQKEMTLNGKMHGYMRMYWGKKIIEWSRTPEEAFKTALNLNNKYELDGRDANGFTGVAW